MRPAKRLRQPSPEKIEQRNALIDEVRKECIQLEDIDGVPAQARLVSMTWGVPVPEVIREEISTSCGNDSCCNLDHLSYNKPYEEPDLSFGSDEWYTEAKKKEETQIVEHDDSEDDEDVAPLTAEELAEVGKIGGEEYSTQASHASFPVYNDMGFEEYHTQPTIVSDHSFIKRFEPKQKIMANAKTRQIDISEDFVENEKAAGDEVKEIFKKAVASGKVSEEEGERISKQIAEIFDKEEAVAIAPAPFHVSPEEHEKLAAFAKEEGSSDLPVEDITETDIVECDKAFADMVRESEQLVKFGDYARDDRERIARIYGLTEGEQAQLAELVDNVKIEQEVSWEELKMRKAKKKAEALAMAAQEAELAYQNMVAGEKLAGLITKAWENLPEIREPEKAPEHEQSEFKELLEKVIPEYPISPEEIAALKAAGGKVLGDNVSHVAGYKKADPEKDIPVRENAFSGSVLQSLPIEEKVSRRKKTRRVSKDKSSNVG